MKKGFFRISFSLLATILVVIFAVLNVGSTAGASESTTESATGSPSPSAVGSITVCKVVIDENGNIVDASASPGTTFSISGIDPSVNSGGSPVGVIGTSIYTSPLTINADIFASFSGNDAQCTTYSSLAIGAYYYGEELVVSSSGWVTPKYNDQFTTVVTTLSDFFAYDDNLFDGDTSNDDSRNRNADGHIVLNDQRPNRTLIVLNQFEEDGGNTGEASPSPTPTPTPSTGGSNDSNNNNNSSSNNSNSSDSPQVLGASRLADTGTNLELLSLFLGGLFTFGGVWLSLSKRRQLD